MNEPEAFDGNLHSMYGASLSRFRNLPRLGIYGVGLLLVGMMASWTSQTGTADEQPATPVAVTSSTAASPAQTTDKLFPRIAGHGGVFPLPEAAHQPRNGTRLCVDMTAGAEAAQLSPAIEKLARYVNIYAGAGRESATLEMAVILHGAATLKSLDADSYAERFDTEGNPNLALIQTLQEQGVAFYVCGQSLLTLGAAPDEVAEGITVAVSALTCNVNLQQDGYQVVSLP